MQKTIELPEEVGLVESLAAKTRSRRAQRLYGREGPLAHSSGLLPCADRIETIPLCVTEPAQFSKVSESRPRS
jgi:hypothetical protein